MVQIVAQEDMQGTRRMRKVHGVHHVWRTDFLVSSKDQPDAPQAFLAESTPLRVLRPHYHEVDQFQLIVSGGGKLAKHKLAPFGIHFARAYTPYGPIANGAEGIGFLTLRAHPVPGPGQNIPENADRLRRMLNRKPWQTTQMPDFAMSANRLQPVPGLHDANGLAAFTVSLKSGSRVATPDPSEGDGQYVIVLNGSLMRDGREYNAITVAFLRPGEGPFPLVAGAQGLQAMVLNFPRRVNIAQGVTAPAPARAKTWMCELCAFSYSEATGMPEDGIPAGTRWEDVPDSWSCPDCSAGKADFRMVEIQAPAGIVGN